MWCLTCLWDPCVSSLDEPVSVHTFISSKSSLAISEMWDSGYLWLQMGNKPILAFFLLLIYCFRAKLSSPEGCSVGLERVGNLWDQDPHTLYVHIRQIRGSLYFEFSLGDMSISLDSCSSSFCSIRGSQQHGTFMVYWSNVIDRKQLEDIWNKWGLPRSGFS